MNSSSSNELVVALRAAATQLTSQRSIRDLEQTLNEIVTSAVATVPGAEAGSVSMTQYGRVETRQPTSDKVRKLDDQQSELGEGPCMDAIDQAPEDGLVAAHNFAFGPDVERWPRFAPLAVEAGFQSLLSAQLSAPAGGLRAALNLYSSRPEVYDQDAIMLGGLYGAQASLLLYGADQAHHLQRAVDSRDLIGRAKGVLMERFKVEDATAFQMLVKSSQDTNMKLTAVAQWLNDTVTVEAGSAE